MNDLDSLRYRLELLITKATPMSDYDKIINKPDFGKDIGGITPKIPIAEEGETRPYVSNRQKKIQFRQKRQNRLNKLFDKLVTQEQEGGEADPMLMEKVQQELAKMFKIGKTGTNAPTDEREALARKFCAIRMNVERKKAMERFGQKSLKMEKAMWGGDPDSIPEESPNQLKQSQLNFFPQHEKAPLVRPQSSKEGRVNYKRPQHRSLIKNSLNFGFMLEKAFAQETSEGPRDYSQPVDSAEAFKYRRKVPSERRANYEVLRQQGFSPEEATRFKDWKPNALRTLMQNKNMPDHGLDPEWIDNPERKLGKETELLEDYKNAGIKKIPGMEPITPDEAQLLNQYYQQVGKEPIHIPTPEEFQTQQAQYKEMKREGKAPPMFNKSILHKAGDAVKDLEEFIREYEATIRSKPRDWSPQMVASHTKLLNQAKQKLESHYKNKLIGQQPVMPKQPLQTQLPLEY